MFQCCVRWMYFTNVLGKCRCLHQGQHTHFDFRGFTIKPCYLTAAYPAPINFSMSVGFSDQTCLRWITYGMIL